MQSTGILAEERTAPARESEVPSPRALGFEELVVAYQDSVFDFCCRMLGDREEATDQAQEIFISIHQSLASFREASKLSTWVFRVAKNHCLNRLKYLRRRGRGRSFAVEDVAEDSLQAAVPDLGHPDDALVRKDQAAIVHRAIAQLDDDQRALVVLREIEGMAYEEIAGVVDLPIGTVKSRLHRARERLAEIVVAMGVET